MVNTPCCRDCAVQAGRFFRSNEGFQRHPHCRCYHLPTTDPASKYATYPDPSEVTGLTESERKALDEGASDFVMPDLERIGGVSGWQRASALAFARGVPMSSHLYPEVSVHLLAATPTAHWLEYVDWLNPLMEEPLRISEGMAIPSERPGIGVELNDQVAKSLLWNGDTYFD